MVRSGRGLAAEATGSRDEHPPRLPDRWLRINLWTDNTGLTDDYLNNGFKHVRTLDLADYPSGALFQRPCDD